MVFGSDQNLLFSQATNILSPFSVAILVIYDPPGPPKSANLLTIEGPISSYSAFVWQ